MAVKVGQEAPSRSEAVGAKSTDTNVDLTESKEAMARVKKRLSTIERRKEELDARQDEIDALALRTIDSMELLHRRMMDALSRDAPANQEHGGTHTTEEQKEIEDTSAAESVSINL